MERLSDQRIAIIGCGTMGEAILGGLLATGHITADQVVVTTRRPQRGAALAERYGVTALTDNAEAARGADVILLCVKPQSAVGVVSPPEIGQAVGTSLFISICAGVTIKQLVERLPDAQVVRAMPNTPCTIREGMTVVSPGPGVSEHNTEVARAIFSSVGRCRVLEEKHLDAVTGLSGSGPAFACVVIESLADGGVMMGLPRDVAVELASQTVRGAAGLVLQTGLHPAALKDDVTTPGGCTIAGLLIMEDGKIRSTLARTIQEATRIASGLGRER